MLPVAPISYSSLAAIVEWMDPLKRNLLSKAAPHSDFKTAHDNAPLHFGVIEMADNNIVFDAIHTIFQLNARRSDGHPLHIPGAKQYQGATWDVYENGRRDERPHLEQEDIEIVSPTAGRVTPVPNFPDGVKYFLTKVTVDRRTGDMKMMVSPDGWKIRDAIRSFTSDMLGAKQTIFVDRLSVLQFNFVARLPSDRQMIIKEFCCQSNPGRVIDGFRRIIHPSSFPLDTLFIQAGDPTDSVFTNETFRAASRVNICLFSKDPGFVEAIQGLQIPTLLLFGTELELRDFARLLKHWIENPKEISTRLCLVTRNVDAYLDCAASTVKCFLMERSHFLI